MNFFPTVIRCKELPQWIISSDTAAYHSYSNTIYIREDRGLLSLVHEYLHWLFHLTHINLGHKIIDKI